MTAAIVTRSVRKGSGASSGYRRRLGRRWGAAAATPTAKILYNRQPSFAISPSVAHRSGYRSGRGRVGTFYHGLSHASDHSCFEARPPHFAGIGYQYHHRWLRRSNAVAMSAISDAMTLGPRARATIRAEVADDLCHARRIVRRALSLSRRHVEKLMPPQQAGRRLLTCKMQAASLAAA